jgi:hypothetical protein
LRSDFFAALSLCERKEENRLEPRAKKEEPFAHRFLCVSAPLRAKRRKEKRDKGLEPRAKKQEARVVRSLISLRLRVFARKNKNARK